MFDYGNDHFIRAYKIGLSPYSLSSVGYGAWRSRCGAVEGGENIAQFVGFAASVEANHSDAAAVLRIGDQLGRTTQENPAIKLISSPLLGGGSGGLPSEIVIDSLTQGFKRTASANSRLVIFILDEAVFQRVSKPWQSKSDGSVSSEKDSEPLRVFISYCHSSGKHESWVADLGSSLRKNGIDARLDIWHLRRGMDLPQFMANELALAQRVIMVSDEKYAEKADGRIGGVGWETMIVQGDMARQSPDSSKYLVIVVSSTLDDGLPLYLRTKFVIHWTGENHDDQNLRLLLRELYGAVLVPPLGERPVFI